MKTILMATDFSPAALNAANYAAGLAKAMDAQLMFLHVYQDPVLYPEVVIDYTAADALQDAQDNMQNLVQSLSNGPTNNGNAVSIITRGVFFEELEKTCRLKTPDVVIMGSQGTTASERFIFGGHAVHAMKQLRWPLITVPPNALFSGVKKMGLACDLEDVIETIPTDEIRTLVTVFKATLDILNIGKKDKFSPEVVYEAEILLKILHDLHPAYHFLSDENIDKGITDFAEKNSLDLLIIIPKSHSLIDTLMHTGITKQLVLHCQVPVMALHY
jgi:nucleotide-binding universal stress UspA family protein